MARPIKQEWPPVAMPVRRTTSLPRSTGARFGPHHELRSASGRPITIFREGRCLEPLAG